MKSYMGQDGILRPSGTRPAAGPGKLHRRSTDPRAHRVVFDVVRNPFKVLPIAHPPVIALVLPEWLTNGVQHAISFSCRSSLERLPELGHGNTGSNQKVHVIRHHHEAMEREVAFPLPVPNRFDRHSGKLRTPQVQRAGARGVEETVHDREGSRVGRNAGENPILRQAAGQSPRQEDGMAYGEVVREPADVELGHEERVRMASGFSHLPAGRVPLGRRLPTCPTVRNSAREWLGF